MKAEQGISVQGISVLTGKPVEITVADGRIADVRDIEQTGDLPYCGPGFLDMQLNGYRGSDYSLPDLNREDIIKIIRSLEGAGTVSHVPTIVTRPREIILRNLEVLDQTVQDNELAAASIAGIHLEGPYISAEDGPRGAHDAGYIRDPDFDEFMEWQEVSGGRIKMITLAPERKGAMEFISRISETGVIAALGHTGAEPEIIREAVAAGARFSTHLGNGNYDMIHRFRNNIWEQLARDDLVTGMMSDGFHLPPSAVKVFTRAKGTDRIVLVSDAALMGGMEPGVHEWGNIKVRVFDDGHLGVEGTPYLAGAGHLLDWGLAHFVRFTGLPLSEGVKLCTKNPADLLGLPEKTGTLEPGAPGDVTLFRYTPEMDRIKIERTIKGGKECPWT
ncbi:MAG: N-acetylglucosamine-6-phosphate deacetylase [Spirochaetia bacterium]